MIRQDKIRPKLRMRASCLRGVIPKKANALVPVILVLVLLFMLDSQHKDCLRHEETERYRDFGSDRARNRQMAALEVGLPAMAKRKLSNGNLLNDDVENKLLIEMIGLQNSETSVNLTANSKSVQPLKSKEKKSTSKSKSSGRTTNIIAPVSTDSIFNNVTRIGKNKSLFGVLPEEPYLANNKSVFAINTSLNNALKYDFLIDADVCNDNEDVFLLNIIPSVSGDREMRNAIRRTWLGAAEQETWVKNMVGVTMKHIFLLGRHPKADEGEVLRESQLHGDIVLADFVDSYRNLTTKVLAGLQWVKRSCPQAKIVLKVDQDTLLNAPLMAALLKHVRWRAGGDNASFVLGLQHNYKKPIVVRKGRWAVSKESYPLDFFPAYLYGHVYAISSPGGVDRLLHAAPHVPLIPPEDAYLTGVLAKTAGVLRLTSKAFTVCCRSKMTTCEVIWNQRVAFTGVNTPASMDALWSDLMRGICDPKVLYKTNHKKAKSSSGG